MCAGGLVQAMFPGGIGQVRTSISPGTSVAQGLFIEMFMTAELTFVVLMLAAEKSKDTFIAPIGIGLALFVAMLGGTFTLPRILSLYLPHPTLYWMCKSNKSCRRTIYRWLPQPGA
jgi:uncharacterized membrane protein